MRALASLTFVLSLAAFASTKVETPQFTIVLPDGAKSETSVDQTEVGPSVTTTWDAMVGDNSVTFAYTDFPLAAYKALPVETHLNNTRDGSINGSKAKLIKETKLTMQAGKAAVPARDIESATPEVLLNTRIVMQGSRLYILVYGRPVGEKSLAPFQEIVKSFTLAEAGPLKEPVVPAKGAPAAAPAKAAPSTASNEPRVIDTPQFSIVMPAGTTETPSKDESDFGPIIGIDYEAEVGEAFIELSYVDFPAKLVKTAKPAEHLQNAKNGSVSATKATIKSEKKLEVKVGSKTAPGLEVETLTPEDIATSTRFVLVGNRLYTLVYARPKTEKSRALYEAAVASMVFKGP